MNSGLDAPGRVARSRRIARNDGGGCRGTMAHLQAQCYLPLMASILSTFILPIAVGAVALVLLLGLVNMMRGGSPNTSQKLMRWRVLLQFVAIILAMLAVWAMGR